MDKVFKTKSDLNLGRKITHFLMGAVAVILAILLQDNTFQIKHILLIFVFIFALVELIRHSIPAFNSKILSLPPFGEMFREEEKNNIATATYYIIAMAICFWFYTLEVSIISTLYLAIADPIASTLGNKFGKIKIIRNKTLIGFMGFMIICIVINLVASQFLIISSSTLNQDSKLVLFYTAPFLAAFIESFLPFEDNFTVPVLTGAYLSLSI